MQLRENGWMNGHGCHMTHKKMKTCWKEEDEDYYIKDTSSLASIYKAKI
jgi:hypothetical protein